MGGNPSKTRKLTVENDDPGSVIKVSDDVVDRLKGKQGYLLVKRIAFNHMQLLDTEKYLSKPKTILMLH